MSNNSAPRRESRSSGFPLLNYQPAEPYGLDLEVFAVSELRQRVAETALRTAHRYACHVIWCVTNGRCTQVIDFKPVRCEPGTLLCIRPGQVHDLGQEAGWDGWMVLFRPEFLLPLQTEPVDRLGLDLEVLHGQLSLGAEELHAVTDLILRMREDSGSGATPRYVQALLRHQLYVLLLRLCIAGERHEASLGIDERSMRRFRDFRELVERKHPMWHQVAQYATELQCSNRSLTRSTMSAAGVSAKEFIASRINLEAKRLLVHTAQTVTSIGECLGFDEATNFVKFFKREAGCTPTEFRRAHQEWT